MFAVIFAAGRGTRMGILCADCPKPLIEVAGTPILNRTLEAMPDIIDHIVIVVGHLQDAIRHADGIAGRDDITIVEQPELIGTYDALLAAKPHLPDAPFLVVNGDDIYTKKGLSNLVHSTDFAIMTKTVNRPNRYSHLETQNGQLIRIVSNRNLPDIQEQPTTCTYTGAALLTPAFFTLEPATIPNANTVPGAGKEYSLPHTLEKYHQELPVRTTQSPLWLPIGTPEELEVAESILTTNEK